MLKYKKNKKMNKALKLKLQKKWNRIKPTNQVLVYVNTLIKLIDQVKIISTVEFKRLDLQNKRKKQKII